MTLRQLVIAVAWVTAFVAGTRPGLQYGLQPGLLFAVALVPLWLPMLTRYVGAVAITALGVLTMVSSTVLAWHTSTYSLHTISNNVALTFWLRIVALIMILGVLLWVRDQIGTGATAVSYGLGMLLTNLSGIAGSANVWKFQLSVPLTLIVLGALHRRGLVLNLLALTVFTGIGAVCDSRSYSGLAFITALILLFERLRHSSNRSWNRFGLVLITSAGAVGAYFAATSLLVKGILGEEIATRTETQINQSGNLISGGRPEWAATTRLMEQKPFGFGAGVVPTGNDITTVKEGLAAMGVPTYIGYVENYMTANGFKLHSIVADLWASGGIVGLVFAITLMGIITYSLITHIARTGVTALLGYLTTTALWYIMFGPLYSDLPFISVVLALVLIPRKELVQHADPPGELVRS